MEIKLYMNEYLNIYIKENGTISVQIGKLDKDGNKINENSFANSSFSTFMKYLGIELANLDKEVAKYISDNELYIHIKKSKEGLIEYNLHDITSNEELVSYNSFEDLISVEVLQQRII